MLYIQHFVLTTTVFMLEEANYIEHGPTPLICSILCYHIFIFLSFSLYCILNMFDSVPVYSYSVFY